jgi:hypothetical protein
VSKSLYFPYIFPIFWKRWVELQTNQPFSAKSNSLYSNQSSQKVGNFEQARHKSILMRRKVLFPAHKSFLMYRKPLKTIHDEVVM